MQFLFIYFYSFIYSFYRPIKPADLSVLFQQHVVTKAHHALVSLNDEWETESVSTGSSLPTCCREQYIWYRRLISLPVLCSTVARPLQLGYVIAWNNKKKTKNKKTMGMKSRQDTLICASIFNLQFERSLILTLSN